MNKLIPPFLMRETGLKLNDFPKIHIDCQNLMNIIHCIVSAAEDTGNELSIPMQLDGIFSYFPTRKLTQEEIDNCEYINIGYCNMTTN